MNWISLDWWKYVLSPRDRDNDTPFLEVVVCRMKGHPNGTIYYNPGGWEPDDRCKDCYEHIG
jgi:hypothetical protein